MELDLGPGAQCAPCIARPPRWDRARAALVYEAASRRIVLDLKRSGRRDGLHVMTGWMHRAGGQLVAEADLIVPVPLHYTRLVSRGFNQSAWLAQGIALSACTRALKQAGARQVDVLVLARVVRETDVTI